MPRGTTVNGDINTAASGHQTLTLLSEVTQSPYLEIPKIDEYCPHQFRKTSSFQGYDSGNARQYSRILSKKIASRSSQQKPSPKQTASARQVSG
jgi:hypothetical protein